MTERVRRLLQVGDDAHDRKTGVACLPDQLCQIGPIDPIHHEHVAVLPEEVLAYERQVRMGAEREEDAGLAEERVPLVGVRRWSDLERDMATVLVVEGTNHFALAAPPEHCDRLVAV